jgi:naphthoate synthase/2-ketocyclohexanecarboxyl-CoA hydrolase
MKKVSSPRPIGNKYEDIIFEKDGGIARITLNRPDKYNALRTRTYEEIAYALQDADDDPEIGVAVITGAGEKSFCSGGDVDLQAKRTPALGRSHARSAIMLSSAIRNAAIPVVAAVNGYSIGGGHCLHLWCDITIASDRAKFGQVGTKVGSLPYWGPPLMLARMVGEKRAREMLFLCRQYTAQEAYEMGLVNKVVPHDRLMEEVDLWCQEILDKSPLYIGMTKKTMNFATDQLYGALTMGSELLALTYGMPENMEGINAFLEKRKPEFRKYRKALDTPAPVEV